MIPVVIYRKMGMSPFEDAPLGNASDGAPGAPTIPVSSLDEPLSKLLKRHYIGDYYRGHY